MKRITKNSDIKLALSSIRGIYKENFTLYLYTTDSTVYVSYTQDDVSDDCINIEWNSIKFIGDGVINYICTNHVPDEEYSDHSCDKTLFGTTEYYLDKSDDSVADTIKDLTQQISRETTERKQEDSSLKDYIDNQLENVQVDLSDYYNKEEVDTKIDNVSVDLSPYETKEDLSEKLADYYKKEETDSKISDLSEKISNDISVFVKTNDVSNHVTTTDLTTVLKIEETSILNEVGRVYPDKKTVTAEIERTANAYNTSLYTAISTLDSNCSKTYATITNLNTANTNIKNISTDLNSNYVKKSDLNSSLQDYLKKEDYEADKAYYVVKNDISTFVTTDSLNSDIDSLNEVISKKLDKTEFDSEKKSFAKKADVDTSLKDYPTNSSLSTNYVTKTGLNTSLGSYVTSTTLTNKLNSYVQNSSVSTNYVKNTSFNSSINELTTLIGDISTLLDKINNETI